LYLLDFSLLEVGLLIVVARQLMLTRTLALCVQIGILRLAFAFAHGGAQNDSSYLLFPQLFYFVSRGLLNLSALLSFCLR
jgi:hypothetical protein